MAAKRHSSTPTKRVPRTPQEQARRRDLLDAASGELGYGGPITIAQPIRGARHGRPE
jgi:hypothetical protein